MRIPNSLFDVLLLATAFIATLKPVNLLVIDTGYVSLIIYLTTVTYTPIKSTVHYPIILA